MTDIVIRQATSTDDIAAVKTLCWAYRDFLLSLDALNRDIVEMFYPHEKYAALMDRLEVEHARPQGIILIAEQDGIAVGCGMTHALSVEVSEAKRLYITPAVRGTGTGRALCQALIDQARTDGYRMLNLDTSKTLTTARALYISMGFTECGPYQPIPEDALDHLRFFEITL